MPSFSDAVTTLNSLAAADATSFETAWERTVAELLVGPKQLQHRAALEALFRETPLQSPAETVAASVTVLANALQPVPRASNKAPVVQALARWWVDAFGNEPDPDWNGDLQQFRQQLRAIRGLGPETVDRLLLFGANRAVFPVDRGALRIAVRHGWLDLPVEDEDAQSLFRSVTAGVSELQALARGMQQLGETHCGRVPLCDTCPLQPFLPATGPIDPDRC